MDVGSVQHVAGVVTKGRGDHNQLQWVTSFKVQVSNDGTTMVDVDVGAVFTANTDQHTAVVNRFASPVAARYVRILPQTWNLYISMRAAVLLCPMPPTPAPTTPAPSTSTAQMPLLRTSTQIVEDTSEGALSLTNISASALALQGIALGGLSVMNVVVTFVELPTPMPTPVPTPVPTQSPTPFPTSAPTFSEAFFKVEGLSPTGYTCIGDLPINLIVKNTTAAAASNLTFTAELQDLMVSTASSNAAASNTSVWTWGPAYSVDQINFTIPQSVLSPGGHQDLLDYEKYRLVVTAWASDGTSSSHSYNHSFFKVHYLTPPVIISQGTAVVAHRYEMLMLTTRLVTWSHSCILNGGTARYAWSIAHELYDHSTEAMTLSSAGSSFAIPAYTLVAGESYYVTLNTSYAEKPLSAHLQTLYIHVEAATIYVKIDQGHSVLATRGHTARISCTVKDLDLSVKTYSWGMWDVAGNAVDASLLAGSDSTVLTVDTSGLDIALAPYTVTITVDKVDHDGHHPSSATTTLTLTEVVVPSIVLKQFGAEASHQPVNPNSESYTNACNTLQP